MPRDKKSTFVVLAPGSASVGGGGGGLPAAHASTHQNGGGDEINLTGLSGVLADPQTPAAHATAHKSGGSDAIKLDELAAPTDVTTLNASTSAHGLSPKATAPASGLLSVLAIGNGETVRTDKAIFDTTNPAALGTVGPGTSLLAARRDHIHALPALDAVAAPTDITTLNASTTAHGLLKKLSNVSTEFMNGVGNWATPSSGTWTVISNTDTGAQNNWAPAGLSGNTLIEWNGAADIAPTGLAGGTAGQIALFKNVTAAKIATFPHASGSSLAAARYTNVATSAATPVAPGGWIMHQHDGTNWKLVGHEQGAWITPAYASGDYTASTGTWTVDAGDVSVDRYKLIGNTLLLNWVIVTTSVSAVTTRLMKKLPGGFSAPNQSPGPHFYKDAGGAWIFGETWINPSTPTLLDLYTQGYGSGTNWQIATNTTHSYGQVPVEVT